MMESSFVKFVSDLIRHVERFDELHPIDMFNPTPAKDEYYIRDIPVFGGTASEKLGTVKYVEGVWAWVPAEEDNDL